MSVLTVATGLGKPFTVGADADMNANPAYTFTVHLPVVPGTGQETADLILKGTLGGIATGHYVGGDSWAEWCAPHGGHLDSGPVALHLDFVAPSDEQAVAFGQRLAAAADIGHAVPVTTASNWSVKL